MASAVMTQRCVRACSCSPFHVSVGMTSVPRRCRTSHPSIRLDVSRRRAQSCRPGHPLSLLPPTAAPLDLERYLSVAPQSPSETQSRSVLREWTQYLSRISSTVDTSAISRTLTSLNIDIPKNLNELRNILPSVSIAQLQESFFQKRTSHKSSEQTAGSRITSTADVRKIETSTGDAVKLIQHQKPTRRAIKDYAPSSNRERRDFADTMNSMQDSVEAFQHMGGIVDAAQSSDRNDSAKLTADAVKRVGPVTASTKADAAISSSFSSYIPDAVMSTINSVTTGISQQLAGITSGSKSAPATGTNTKPTLQMSTAVFTADDVKKALAERGGSGGGEGDGSKPDGDKEMEQVAKPSTVRRQLVARGSIERQTRGLVLCLRDAKSATSQVIRLEELCKHFILYPDCTGIAMKSKVLPCLLRLRESRDVSVSEKAYEALSLVGYVNPLPGRGIRVLCLDGGGTKGLVSISIMKLLEQISSRPIHELFDYVCGVSTGSLIGIMAAVFRVPVGEMEEIYKEFSVQMFERNRLIGAGKLFMSHAYYDTELWERILRENIGLKTLSETARDPNCPKFSAVSTLINVPRLQNFLFRNYNLPTTRQSHYTGSVNHHVWEAIRASSAAPGYYEECTLGDWVHQDGGLLTNNPTAIAIHECRQLWPGVPLQCVVSIGTGKFEPTSEPAAAASKSSSLKMKVTKIVESATDTEAVHTVLHDLLPASSYFRFNPYMSEDFLLDEIRPEKWDQMRNDTEMYCRKNTQQIERSVARLLEPKPSYARAVDWLRLKLDQVA